MENQQLTVHESKITTQKLTIKPSATYNAVWLKTVEESPSQVTTQMLSDMLRNGQHLPLKRIENEDLETYTIAKLKMIIYLDKFFKISGVKNIPTDSKTNKDWMELLLQTHGHWLTFECWVLFINRLKLGMVGDKNVEFYENLNLPKIAGWLVAHNEWVKVEMVREDAKYLEQKMQAEREYYDLLRKEHPERFETDPESKLFIENLQKEVAERETLSIAQIIKNARNLPKTK
jgi:hypothetical protein